MKEFPEKYTPSADEVERYIAKWYGLENYVNQEHALDKLFFELCPKNVCVEDILLKCSSLNDFYSTNIFDIHSVALHILSLNIDERLQNGDISLVEDIAHVEVGANKEERVFYSFATKYCSHHQPMRYSIYDNYVEKVLWHFQKKDKFSTFCREELKDYDTYMKAIKDFQDKYNLSRFNIKQLDQYLWQLGKEYFNPREERSKNRQQKEVRVTKAMERALKNHGLTADDLTTEQLEELHQETILRRKGIGILDGVLHRINAIPNKRIKKDN